MLYKCIVFAEITPDQITVIANEMGAHTSILANVVCQIKQVGVIFTHLELWFAVARHNFQVGENLDDLIERGKGSD